jgi:hypothetical protein
VLARTVLVWRKVPLSPLQFDPVDLSSLQFDLLVDELNLCHDLV